MKLTKLATALLLSGALTLSAATVSAADLNLSVAQLLQYCRLKSRQSAFGWQDWLPVGYR